jgi:hypothetical protein
MRAWGSYLLIGRLCVVLCLLGTGASGCARASYELNRQSAAVDRDIFERDRRDCSAVAINGSASWRERPATLGTRGSNAAANAAGASLGRMFGGAIASRKSFEQCMQGLGYAR